MASSRTQVEGLVRELEALRRYRTFVHNSSEGIWRCELDHPINPAWDEDEQVARMFEWSYLAECNPAMARMYGYESPDQLNGARLADLLIRTDPKNEAFLREFIRSGYKLNDAESHECDREGRDRYFLNSFTGEMEEGLLVRAWGTQRDITERKSMEEALRHSEERFSCFMEHLPGAAWIKDIEGRYIYANPQAENIFNTALADLLGKTDADVFPAATAEQFRENDRQALEGGSALRTVEVLQQADGLDHHSVVHKFPITAGGATYVGGVAVDITELLRAQRALRQTEERFRRIVATSGVSIWEEDFSKVKAELDQLRAAGVSDVRTYLREHPDFVRHAVNSVIIRDVNEATLTMFGARSRDELMNSLTRIFLPETMGVFEEELAAIFNGDTALESEASVKTLNGEKRFVRLSIAFPADDPHLERVSVCLMDITDRRRAEEALRKANAELEEFAYLASHDLQEPLRTVSAFTELLLQRQGEAPAADIAEFSGYIQEAVKRMNVLIQDAQVYSRTIHSDDNEAQGVADLNQCLDQALGMLSSRIGESGAIITAEPLPRAVGDPAQFSQVFQNLVSNSLKYRHSERAPRVEIRSERHDAEWLISIQDNGIGFDPRYRERIFGLFKRLHRSEYPGTGLGLAICKRVVERYGGKIWADSVPGEGSTFRFTCRAVPADEQAAG
jgi:PAS domain S-box-containing protein